MFQLGLFDTVAHAESFMETITPTSTEDMEKEWKADFATSTDLELGSLTIEQVEHLTTIGEKANFVRIKAQIQACPQPGSLPASGHGYLHNPAGQGRWRGDHHVGAGAARI